jgi:hypothetical protein
VTGVGITECRAEIEFAVVTEAGPEFAVGGEAHFIAGLAEVGGGDGADEADEGAGVLELVIFGGAPAEVVGRLRDEFILAFEDLDGFLDGEEVGWGEDVGRGERHEFDEAEREVMFGGEEDERPDFVFVDAAHEDAIEFDAFEAGVDGGADAGEDEVKVAAGDVFVEGGVEGIEADVDGADSGVAERDGDGGEACGVGGEGDAFDAGDGGHGGGDVEEIGADEGFAAGEAEFAEAEGDGGMDDAEEFLGGEVIGFTFPAFVTFGHAIEATFVAAVGDGDAEIVDFTSEGIHRSSV